MIICISLDSHCMQNKGVGVAYFHNVKLFGIIGNFSLRLSSQTSSMLMTWPYVLFLGTTLRPCLPVFQPIAITLVCPSAV